MPLWSARAPRTPVLPASEEVQSIAKQYVDSLKQSTQPERVNQARADFIHAFLRGFTNSEGAVGSSNDAVTKGFEAGQNYRHKNPEMLAHTMTGFGYTAIDILGTWQIGPELSGFAPGKQRKAIWWLSILGNSPAAKSDISPEHCSRANIVGFLSPAGRYGHMGGFTHEVFVYEMNCGD
jgi:hypothetical protein